MVVINPGWGGFSLKKQNDPSLRAVIFILFQFFIQACGLIQNFHPMKNPGF
jgi:hypothetical protein